MKRLGLILSIILLSLQPLSAQNNDEFRGTWVITWEHLSDSTTIKKILDNHVRANMNAVIYQVRQGGTAYYPSSYEPWGHYANYESPGYDPFEFVIEAAHNRGLEVHAWFNTFHTSSTIDGAPAEEHPDWVCRDGYNKAMPSSKALSPALQEVRDYTLNVAMEIVNNYDIDGFHLDYIRWNEYTTSSVLEKSSNKPQLDGHISRHQKELLQSATTPERYLYDKNHKYSDGVPEGYDSWEEFWRTSVTKFVVSLHDSIQSVKPHVRLSVAALGKYRWSFWQGYESVYQDAGLWYNEGYIEQLMPMHYHWNEGDEFLDMLAGIGEDNWDYWLEDDSDVLYSVGPGSYILAQDGVWDNHSEIVESSRTVDYVDGFQFFSYGTWKDYLYFEEAGATFFSGKTKIRRNENYTGEVPAAPAISLEKHNSMNYSITVTPEETEKMWYLVYRSEDGSVDPDTDEIIAIKLTNTPFTVEQHFDGNQNFSGNYTYVATAANRYWWESTVSNSQTSDHIISNPPVIVGTSPTENDTIDINTEIVLEFSKEIEFSTIDEAFSLSPEATINSFNISDNWDNRNKVVTINISDMDYGTEYTVTLSDELTDLNGTAFDGDYDGTAGGNYTFSFYTRNIDQQAPQLLSSYPENNATNLDPDDTWNLYFDELIDEESVTNRISVMSDGQPLTTDWVLSEIEGKSIISIKTKSTLATNANFTIRVNSGLADTAGNSLEYPIDITGKTADHYYTEKQLLDNFTGANEWWDPDGSGSTLGTVGSDTKFSIYKLFWLPGYNDQKSGRLQYKWDMEFNGEYLLREHCPDGSDPIDSTYTMQCYIYGDNSNTLFRFSLYEKDGGQTAEVSKWIPIDWTGWKLVEWDLSDPSMIGEWLGNGEFDGGYYTLDGVHLTRTENSAVSGEIFIDNLSAVKKSTGNPPANFPPVVEELEDATIEKGDYHKIYVNYTDPNGADAHEIIGRADTSAIVFNYMGHESGDRVYVIPDNDFTGESKISIIVKDFGIGELSDTTTYTLTVGSNAIDNKESLVTEYSLKQNYPNPFNPETSIEFSLPKKGRVTITIFDLRGNLIRTLVNDSYPAGNHNIVFDAADLATGVYIYQMQSGRKLFTKKMMLLK